MTTATNTTTDYRISIVFFYSGYHKTDFTFVATQYTLYIPIVATRFLHVVATNLDICLTASGMSDVAWTWT